MRRRPFVVNEGLALVSTTSAYLGIESNLPRQLATTAAQGQVKNDTAYYLANIGSVKTVADFVGNYRLFSYAMKAYGLTDMTYAKGLISKLLTEGTTSPTALANTLSDSRYKAFATAFNFAANGTSTTAATSATTDTVSKYVQQTLEDTQGQQNQGVELALYFSREASSVTNVYGILADPALLKVVQTTFGIPAASGVEDIDTQAAYLSKVLNVSDLQDPTKVQKLVTRFTAMWDASGNNTSSNTVANALLVSSSTSGLGYDLLLSIANLKLGG